MNKKLILCLCAMGIPVAGMFTGWLLQEGLMGAAANGKVTLFAMLPKVCVILAGAAVEVALAANIFRIINGNEHVQYVGLAKGLLRLFAVFLLAALVCSLLCGGLAVLLRALFAKSIGLAGVRRIVDVVTTVLSLGLLPVFLHAVLRFGLFEDSFQESLQTLGPKYLLLCAVLLALFVAGYLLQPLGIAGTVITVLLEAGTVLAVLWKYTEGEAAYEGQ